MHLNYNSNQIKGVISLKTWNYQYKAGIILIIDSHYQSDQLIVETSPLHCHYKTGKRNFSSSLQTMEKHAIKIPERLVISAKTAERLSTS